MSFNPQEIVEKLSPLQNMIWQSVSLSVSEATNQAINMGNPITVSQSSTELMQELSQPHLVIQFAFADVPESSQVVLISNEHFSSLASMILESPVAEPDDNTVADTRAGLESIVQGICLAVSNLRNGVYVATGLSIRVQIFSMPPNMLRGDDVYRTNIAVTGDALNITMTWLMDIDTACLITGETVASEDGTFAASADETAAPTFAAPSFGGSPMQFPAAAAQPQDQSPSLEILMDIPLELSVELGRVKKLVRDVVELGAGSIVEIDKAAGEPVDILVNGRFVARGEVVVIEDNFGVRITEIMSPQDRLARLNDAA